MRSTFFVILSLAFHALCVAAVAITPTKIMAPEGNEVEVIMEEPALKPGVEIAEAEVIQAQAPAVTEVKPAVKEIKKAKKPTLAKVIESKTTETKVVETKVTELPPKEDVAQELDPEISDEAAVAVVPAMEKDVHEEKVELIPVKEKVAGVEAMTSDEDSEATSTEIQESEDDDSSTSPAGAANDVSDTLELAQGGGTKSGAVSYLDLKQAPGNKGPQYPLQARKEARQGQVELLYRVTKEGKVADLQVAKSSGFKDLDQEAVRAVSAFRFVPGQEGWARHPVAFSLKGTAATLPSRLRSNSAQAE